MNNKELNTEFWWTPTWMLKGLLYELFILTAPLAFWYLIIVGIFEKYLLILSLTHLFLTQTLPPFTKMVGVSTMTTYNLVSCAHLSKALHRSFLASPVKGHFGIDKSKEQISILLGVFFLNLSYCDNCVCCTMSRHESKLRVFDCHTVVNVVEQWPSGYDTGLLIQWFKVWNYRVVNSTFHLSKIVQRSTRISWGLSGY